jgi:hypothetical protein
LVGSFDSTLGTADQVDDQAQVKSEDRAEGETKIEEEGEVEEEKKSATG